MKKSLLILILSLIIISGCNIWEGRHIDLPENNTPEVQTHSECINEYCMEVRGEGVNQCSTDLDCKIETHLDCVNKLCVEVAGPGQDKCTFDSNCRSSGGGGGSGGDDNPPPEEPVVVTSFGIYPQSSSNLAINISATKIKDLQIKYTSDFEDWHWRQPTNESNYLWNGRDRMMYDFTEASGASIYLRITPWGLDSNGDVNWYCDPTKVDDYSCVFLPEYEDDFRDYVTALVQRYPDMPKIQFGNEWTGAGFIGDEYDYVKYANWVYDIAKNNSPDMPVVLGSITSLPMKYVAHCLLDESDPNYLDHFYYKGYNIPEENLTQACNGFAHGFVKFQYALENAKYDMVDIHLYDDPENWDEYVNILRSMTDKPVIVSEFGGPSPHIPETLNETFQAEELRKYMDKILEMNILEAHYFQLVETPATYHSKSGLIKATSLNPLIVVEKPTYNVFKEYTNGAQLSPQILYSPERASVAAPALLSLIIGFIGVLVIIIYLLSIILNRKL